VSATSRVGSILIAVVLVAAAGCSEDRRIAERVRPVDAPAAPGSAEPDLAVGADGRLYLSWIEPAGEAHALRFAVWEDDGWSEARTVVTGHDWFVNWADFPSLAASRDGTLVAHWLVRAGPSKYAYDVKLAVSRDGGASWSDPVSPHRDGTETEHGFVSIVPEPGGTFEILWLDGRETAVDDRGQATGTGVMTLRSANLDREGTLGAERLIDERVCDCCSTDAVIGADGAVLAAFRDRSESEIRDIALARLGPDGWTPGGLVHADGWEISACPVNGPALAATGDRVACAWFTAPDRLGSVRVAFSEDGGRSFGDPIRIDSGKPVGRVDVVQLDDGTAVVSWLEAGAVRLRWVTADGPLSVSRIAAATEESRASGFPRLERLGDDLFLAWTQPGEPSRVRTARLSAAAPRD
jgi:hypothetical protein